MVFPKFHRVRALMPVLLFPFLLEAQEPMAPAGAAPAPQDVPITVVPDHITWNAVDFPAHTITVNEASANMIFSQWRSEIAPQSRDLRGRRPAVAKGAVIPSLSPRPLTVLAIPSGDRKAGFARLTLAFAENDSTPLADDGSQQQYMHDLAIRLNQHALSERIRDKQRELDRAQKRAERAGSNEQRTQNRMQRAEDRLKQAQLRRERHQAEKAEQEGTVIGLQRKVAITDSEQDRKRLIRARRNLTRSEAQVLKQMEREARLEADINKFRGQLPDHDRDQRERSAEVERLEREIHTLEMTRESLE
jgi:hypothetical protein